MCALKSQSFLTGIMNWANVGGIVQRIEGFGRVVGNAFRFAAVEFAGKKRRKRGNKNREVKLIKI